jgi:hypothetical protein
VRSPEYRERHFTSTENQFILGDKLIEKDLVVEADEYLTDKHSRRVAQGILDLASTFYTVGNVVGVDGKNYLRSYDYAKHDWHLRAIRVERLDIGVYRITLSGRTRIIKSKEPSL